MGSYLPNYSSRENKFLLQKPQIPATEVNKIDPVGSFCLYLRKIGLELIPWERPAPYPRFLRLRLGQHCRYRENNLWVIIMMNQHKISRRHGECFHRGEKITPPAGVSLAGPSHDNYWWKTDYPPLLAWNKRKKEKTANRNDITSVALLADRKIGHSETRKIVEDIEGRTSLVLQEGITPHEHLIKTNPQRHHPGE